MTDRTDIHVHPILTSEQSKHKDNFVDAINLSTAHIIEQSVKLNSENLEMHIKIKDLEKCLESKDEEIDKFENQMRYLKGLLNNLNEIRKEYTFLNKLYITKASTYLKISKNIQCDLRSIFLRLFLTIIIINWIIIWINIGNKKINTLNIISLPILYKLYLQIDLLIKNMYTYKENLKLIDNNNNISTKTNEIRILEESCLSLDNWINEV